MNRGQEKIWRPERLRISTSRATKTHRQVNKDMKTGRGVLKLVAAL